MMSAYDGITALTELLEIRRAKTRFIVLGRVALHPERIDNLFSTVDTSSDVLMPLALPSSSLEEFGALCTSERRFILARLHIYNGKNKDDPIIHLGFDSVFNPTQPSSYFRVKDTTLPKNVFKDYIVAMAIYWVDLDLGADTDLVENVKLVLEMQDRHHPSTGKPQGRHDSSDSKDRSHSKRQRNH